MSANLFAFLLLLLSVDLFAQDEHFLLSPIPRICGTDLITEQYKATHSDYDEKYREFQETVQRYQHTNYENSRTIITIPVVVHVVFNDISRLNDVTAELVQSQIDALNRDFGQTNNDFSYLPAIFTNRCSNNSNIRFCLAKRRPDGGITNGIDGRITDVATFPNSVDADINQSVKGSNKGVPAWDRTKYLNIWVCDLGNTSFGFTPPISLLTGMEWRDGVVVDYRVFGTIGQGSTEKKMYGEVMGRTCVHEVGHYLGLDHLPGGFNATCGNDNCEDTPLQRQPNTFTLPAFPVYNDNTMPPDCPSITNEGNMFMNYMDYIDDKGRIAFTNGQKAIMNGVLGVGGYRSTLKNSDGCLLGTSVQQDRGGAYTSRLYVDEITTNSAFVHWSSANASSYQLSFKKTTQTAWTNTPSTTTNSVILTGLSAGTEYEIKLNYTTPSGSVIPAPSAPNFTTNVLLSLPTPAPADASNTRESATNITLSTSGTITTTTIDGHTIGSAGDEDWFKFTTTASQPFVKITLQNLPLDYDVRMFKNNSSIPVGDIYLMLSPGTMPDFIKYPSGTNPASAGDCYVQVKAFRNVVMDANNGTITRPADFDSTHPYRLIINTSATSFSGKKEDIDDETTTNKHQLLIYPNPAQKSITITIPSDDTNTATIQVFDLMGHLLLHTHQSTIAGNNKAVIDVSSLPPNVYIVKAIVNNEVYVNKLTIF